MIINKIAEELAVNANQVQAAVSLLDEGATVPFIARYRKEATQGLDDTQLRNLEQRLTYLRELEDRRSVILFRRIPKPGWKIYTCPTSHVVALKVRSLLKPGLSL